MMKNVVTLSLLFSNMPCFYGRKKGNSFTIRSPLHDWRVENNLQTIHYLLIHSLIFLL